jgi:hypothetical protein
LLQPLDEGLASAAEFDLFHLPRMVEHAVGEVCEGEVSHGARWCLRRPD